MTEVRDPAMSQKTNSKNASTIRIPYYRAPFYFSPEYLATAETWQIAFRGLVEDILRQNGCDGQVIDVHSYQIKIGWEALEFTINARFGTFEVRENSSNPEFWGGVEDIPPPSSTKSGVRR
jgi:hypothetical protein